MTSCSALKKTRVGKSEFCGNLRLDCPVVRKVTTFRGLDSILCIRENSTRISQALPHEVDSVSFWKAGIALMLFSHCLFRWFWSFVPGLCSPPVLALETVFLLKKTSVFVVCVGAENLTCCSNDFYSIPIQLHTARQCVESIKLRFAPKGKSGTSCICGLLRTARSKR